MSYECCRQNTALKLHIESVSVGSGDEFNDP
jgi:hypothetical protein